MKLRALFAVLSAALFLVLLLVLTLETALTSHVRDADDEEPVKERTPQSQLDNSVLNFSSAKLINRLVQIFPNEIPEIAKDRNERAFRFSRWLPLCRDRQFAFAVLGRHCPGPNSLAAGALNNSLSWFFGWQYQCLDERIPTGTRYSFLRPSTTWTEARNVMNDMLQKYEDEQRCQFLYHIYIDDSVVLQSVNLSSLTPMTTTSFTDESHLRVFANWLIEEMPLIGYPLGELSPIVNDTRWSTYFDSQVVCLFFITAVVFVLFNQN